MENEKTFVNETDYKELFLSAYDQRKKLEDIVKDRENEIEGLREQIAELEKQVADLKEDAASTESFTSFLSGQIIGLKYAIRYSMTGGEAL